MSTNGINNEEAFEENEGTGRGCLFLRCSSKQTTSQGGFQPPSAVSAPRGADIIPVRGQLAETAFYSHPHRFFVCFAKNNS